MKHISDGGSEVCVPWWDVWMGTDWCFCCRSYGWAFEVDSVGLCEVAEMVIFRACSGKVKDLLQLGIMLVSSEMLDQDDLSESLSPHP